MPIAVSLLLLVAAARLPLPIPSSGLTDEDTVLLVGLENDTGDAIFDDSLDQALRTALEESPFLSVQPRTSIVSTLAEMGCPRGTALTPVLSRSVCQRTQGKAYITGSVRRQSTGFALALEAVNCENGSLVASAEAAAPVEEKILDALGDAVDGLRVQLGEPEASVRQFSTPLSRATSPSLEALHAWAAAIRTQQESPTLASGSQAALPLLEQAVELDPDFASAIFAIGYIYRDALQEGRATEFLTRAFALRDRASIREGLRIAGMYYTIVTLEYEKAVGTYEKWTRDYPRDARAVSNFGSFYGDVCRFRESIAQFRKAREMSPRDVIPHEDLIELLLADGQFEEAREAYREMLRMKLDDDSPHLFMYTLAFLRQDAEEMAEQAGWFDGKPELRHEILAEEADAEAFLGHLARSRELTHQAVESAVRVDNREQAAAWQLSSAWRELLFGNAEEARRQVLHALEIAPESREEGAIAAVLLARLGDTEKADAIARDLNRRYPVHSVVQTYWLPCIRAQIRLADKDPAGALRELERARQFDLLIPQVAYYSPMLSVVIRAEAQLALGNPAKAAEEWNVVIEHPGIVQLNATAPIVRLELARISALRARGGTPSARARARSGYQVFLSLWKDADAGIPVLNEAQAELSALGEPSR